MMTVTLRPLIVRAAGRALLLFLSVSHAGAQDAEPPRRLEVRSLAIQGVSGLDVDAIKEVLATRESGGLLPFLGRDRFFDRRQFQADLYRIVAFLSDHGWPRARVTDVDIVEDTEDEAIDLVVHVDQGPPVMIERVELYGFDVLKPEDQAAIRRRVQLEAGTRRVQGDVRNSRGATLFVLRERGYAYATVDILESEGSAPGQVSLFVVADPGPPSVFGQVTVQGNSGVSDGRVKSLLTIKEGQPFRISRVSESQRRLYNREIFQFATIDADRDGPPGTPVPVTVTLTQAKPRRLSLAPGYGSEEQARINATVRHVNFFGGARTASATTKWSSLDRGVRLNFEEPSLFRRGISMGVGTQFWFADEPAYELTTRGGRMTLAKEYSRSDPVQRRQSLTTLSMTFVNDFERYTISEAALADPTFRDELIALGLDPRRGIGEGTLLAVGFDLQHNTTPNLIDARRGYLLQLHVEQAGRWLPGDFNYMEYVAEGRHYHSIGGAVIASKLRVGTIDAPGVLANNVPFFKRYFLGGSSSLRGWGRFQVGPLSGSGLPLGGHSHIESSVELRQPLRGNFSAVLFADAGNAWDGSFDFHPDDLRVAVGPGLRYRTPIGPVRVDFGYQVNRVDGLRIDGVPEPRRWRVHFSIGQAF